MREKRAVLKEKLANNKHTSGVKDRRKGEWKQELQAWKNSEYISPSDISINMDKRYGVPKERILNYLKKKKLD
jgi:hypothetical protein